MYAFGDGVPHTPEEYAQLLASLAKSGSLTPDEYSRGGVVEKLEARMASLLGKESAVWLPTGTLANHLAVRLLAGDRRRVLVQAESHLFNDWATAPRRSAACTWCLSDPDELRLPWKKSSAPPALRSSDA
jgi:threonine aldolase